MNKRRVEMVAQGFSCACFGYKASMEGTMEGPVEDSAKELISSPNKCDSSPVEHKNSLYMVCYR